uniref:UDP-glycosyltransferase 75D1-like n=1 Tax=Erigeron canadensis TaxID=72917 RepID=UPI001CB9A3C3|nr:UDP-glycosyltransferase 75D1-like [Erigeron canadensis]
MLICDYHVLLVCLPHQSHINPTLRLATKLARAGAQVTFATTVDGLNNLKNRPSLPTLSYDSFSEEGAKGKTNYLEEIKRVGSASLKNLLLTKAENGQKINFIIYGLALPWVAEVARELHVPSAFFFFQSGISFSAVYNFFKSNGGLINSKYDTNSTIKIPGLPLLNYDELPGYLQPSHASYSPRPSFIEHIQILEKCPNPLVLINSSEELEETSTISIPNHITIFFTGSLVYNDIKKPLVCDIFDDLDRGKYLQWLDSKPDKSVIYVSFGSIAELHKNQKEELFQGLILSGYSFLLVLRDHEELIKENYHTLEKDNYLIVKWCSQVEVLNHASIGCFVMHCGWNSIMESVLSGVPVVGCPQFADQMMNAKMVEQVWGNGVKAVEDGDSDGVVGREETKRCLMVVMGDEMIKMKCEKLKYIAMKAMGDCGSSSKHLEHLFKYFEDVLA